MHNATEELDPIERQMVRAGALNRDDLMFNQVGELSPRQKRWLMVEIVGWGAQIGFDLLLIACAWFVYHFQFPQNIGAFLLGGLFWTGLLGTSLFSSLLHARPIWIDMKADEVKNVAGTISKQAGWGSGAPHGRRRLAGANWSLEIRDHQFSIHPSVYHSLINHQSYRLFYTPTLKRVINIEPLFHLDTEKQSALAALQQHSKENEEKPI